ncbi:hypothetical protein [Bradyrhizobium yuanmingense]|uniref:hypothetical protein n=1 Tax=Bradyrhizobium yuanmingense TaxID=108015 RepID=UPI0023B8B22C|nr:hypothetical protein [Bradyrhizobium yuanmingense]MDF0499028.1 hypothetical protein [Bradyrhizobium yuanmingense]
MHDWKKELDALVAEATAFAKTLKIDVERPQRFPSEDIEQGGLSSSHYGGREREEIKRRVERFQAQQRRFMREREEYADSLLRRIKPVTKT